MELEQKLLEEEMMRQEAEVGLKVNFSRNVKILRKKKLRFLKGLRRLLKCIKQVDYFLYEVVEDLEKMNVTGNMGNMGKGNQKISSYANSGEKNAAQSNGKK